MTPRRSNHGSQTDPNEKSYKINNNALIVIKPVIILNKCTEKSLVIYMY